MTDQEKIFDLSGALSRMGGDHTLLQDLVQIFLEDSPGLFSQVTDALRAHDAVFVERAAHSLKGLILSFGAERAGQAALQLEQAGRAGNFAGTNELALRLEAELALLTRALTTYLEKSE